MKERGSERRFGRIEGALGAAVLAMVIAACGNQAIETPKPTPTPAETPTRTMPDVAMPTPTR